MMYVTKGMNPSIRIAIVLHLVYAQSMLQEYVGDSSLVSVVSNSTTYCCVLTQSLKIGSFNTVIMRMQQV